MQSNIGIPRALLYHEFGKIWSRFFSNLNIATTLSPETNKQILDRGTQLSIDESCLPLKLYIGHTEWLLSRCSHLFIPRVTGYYPGFYLCAKFAGLPDIIRNTFDLPPNRIISPNIESKTLLNQLKAVCEISHKLKLPKLKTYKAYTEACNASSTSVNTFFKITSSQPKIAVIGHSYLTKDAFFCRDIFAVLASRNIEAITPEHIPPKASYQKSRPFYPEMYWQLSAKITGAATMFSRRKDIAGIIMVSSFGCGPDSLVNEYIEHHILKSANKPYTIITLDEHTGSAGIITRTEAFLDLIDWGEYNIASNISSHGNLEHPGISYAAKPGS